MEQKRVLKKKSKIILVFKTNITEISSFFYFAN